MGANEFLKIFTKRKELVQWVEELDYNSTIVNGIFNEVPGGLINGSNIEFTTSTGYESGTLRVHLNGERDLAFTELTSTTFKLTGDFVPQAASGGFPADQIFVDYEKELTGITPSPPPPIMDWTKPFNIINVSQTLSPDDLHVLTNNIIPIVLTLPSSPENGDFYNIKKISPSGISYYITVTPGDSSQLIDGQPTYTILYQYDSAYIKFDGTNWNTM